jgi:multiple sugar transport system substrate-binding protein
MQEDRLRVAVRKFDPFQSTLQKLWDAYRTETGCDLTLEAVPLDLHPLRQSTLTGGGLKSGAWDIAHISTDWIAEAFSSGATEDLAPFISKNPPEDFPQGWPSSLLGMQARDGKVLGLPFHDGPECLIYRKDLFEDDRYREEFTRKFGRLLAPPATWEHFRETASFFQEAEKGLYGTVLAGYPDGHNAVFDFCLQLWTRGGALSGEDGRIRIDTREAAAGLEYYRDLMRHGGVHPRCRDFESVAAGMAFAAGEAAMAVNWFGFAAFAEISPDSAVRGRTGIAPVPRGQAGGHVSLNSYWLYTVGSGSRHKETAYDFIRYAVNKNNDKLLTLEGGIGCRLSTCQDPEINSLIPYYHQLEELHSQARCLPAIPEWPEVAAIIDEVVGKALETGEPASTLLKEAQEKIDQIIKS